MDVLSIWLFGFSLIFNGQRYRLLALLSGDDSILTLGSRYSDDDDDEGVCSDYFGKEC
jgi:hypothetical protein